MTAPRSVVLFASTPSASPIYGSEADDGSERAKDPAENSSGSRTRAPRAVAHGGSGARISASASGARCARTTATTGDAWNYFTPRPGPLARVSLGRGRARAASPTTRQLLLLRLALWNGSDPILKERLFGLTNSEGNHGEDVKEYYFYLDSTPTHSYMKYLLQVSAGGVFRTTTSSRPTRRRTRHEYEYELLDTGVFDDDRYFDVVRRVREGVARRHPDPDHRRATAGQSRRRSTCCRRSGSATRGRGTATSAAAGPC